MNPSTEQIDLVKDDCPEGFTTAPSCTMPSNTTPSAEGLAQIAVKVEKFLCEQVRRLSDLIDQCSECLARGDIAQQLIEQLHDEKKQWEIQREEEISQIEQEHARLIAAWEKLESEERRLAGQASSVPAISDGRPANSISADSCSDRPSVQAGQLGRDGMNAQHTPSISTEPTVSRLQFEQLKREIRNHVRRSRRTN